MNVPKRRVSPLQADLRSARRALDEKRAEEAAALLEALRKKSPRNPEVLQLLVVAYRDLGRHSALLAVLETLQAVAPSESHRTLLGLVNIQQGFPYSGFDELGLHPPAVSVPTELQAAWDVLLRDLPAHLPPAEGWALRRAQENVRRSIEQDDLRSAARHAHDLLTRWPDDTWTLGIAAQVELREDRVGPALDLARQALAQQPDDLQGLAVAIRSLAMQGNFEAAYPYAALLKAVPDHDSGVVFEKLRALSYLGDHAGIIATIDQWTMETVRSPEDEAGIYAWVGIAAAALGQVDAARTFLSTARERRPEWTLILDNLADLDRPPAQRHGAFALRLDDWLGTRFVATHAALIQRALQAPSESGRRQAAQALARAHPALDALLAVLVERSDPAARRLALEVAKATHRTDVLIQFVHGQAAEDAERWSVAQELRRQGLLNQPTVRMWVKGEWRDLQLMTFELKPDARVEHRQQVARLVDAALDAYRKAAWAEAETLIRQALTREPSSVDLQLNLATVCLRQGRLDTVEGLLSSISPENGRAVALWLELRVAQTRLEEALAMVAPSLSRAWSQTDFARFCDASMRLNHALGRPDENASVQEARRWAIPDDGPVPWQV